MNYRFSNIVLYRRPDVTDEVLATVEKAVRAHGLAGGGQLVTWVDGGTKITSDDLVVSIGGDGTFLAACRLASDVDAVVTGVNLGRRGFLPEGVLTDLDKTLSAVFAGRVVARSTIVTKDGQLEGRRPAINDIFVTMPGKYTGEFAVDVNGTTILRFIGEGVLVNTPTGSTAMAITAGGNVIAPDAKVLQIVPVNAHALHVRPFVVDDDALIKIRFARKPAPANEAEIFFDGISYKTTSDAVDIRKSKNVYILQSYGYDFYQRVVDRMFRDIEYSV